MEVAPVLEISRAKEARAKLSVGEANLGEGLGDGRLPCPCETIQPEHAVVSFILQPSFELEEDVRSSSLQAPLPVPGAIPGHVGGTNVLQKVTIFVSLFASHDGSRDQKE